MLQNQILVRRWKQWLVLPVLVGLFFAASQSTSAQSVPPPVRVTPNPSNKVLADKPGKVYTYVEQMPQLPGGGGQRAIVEAIQNKIVFPKAAPGETIPSGRVYVSFLIAGDGSVQETKIVKGLAPAFDKAVLSAVKQLPRFEPGKQNGQLVTVILTVPIEFQSKP